MSTPPSRSSSRPSAPSSAPSSADPQADTFDRVETVAVEPFKAGFGARVNGPDLSKPLSAELATTLREAWAKHGFLVFPNQTLTPAQLEAFTESIGQFGTDPFIEPMKGHPNILELRREANETAQNFGAAWHSDWSFQPCPPAGTLLHSKVVPPVGGDTLYADGHRAWEALSETMRGMLEGLRATHSASFAYGPSGIFAKETAERTMKIIVSEDAEDTETHPVVRTHPVTGRKSIFVNPVYTVGIEGLTPAENFVLLKFLYDHMTQSEFVHRHKWEPDMLVLWDNRSTMHFADGGYDGHLRVLHRTTLAGDRPH